MPHLDFSWLTEVIRDHNPVQADSKTTKAWFIRKDGEPEPFLDILYEDCTQFFCLTGFWGIWAKTVPENEPIVWRSRPAMIQSKNEDGMPVWRIEARYGVGEEQ